MPCFVCSQHAVYPSAGAKNVHMEKHHLIWGAVICCSSPLTSDGQNSSPTPPTPASTDKAFVLLLHMKSQSGWKTNAHSCLSEPILLFFLLHCQKKVFSSNELPSSISTSERSAPTNQQSSASSVDVLAWMAFLWIELADAISDCCSSVVVFTKGAVWSNATALYPQRVCRNKTCAWRIAFWHVNRAMVAEQWTQGNS